MSLRTLLFIGGALSEFAGIVLIAFPDLLPGAKRASGWLGRRARVLENRVRRLLGRPPRPQFISMSGTVSASGALSVSATVGLKPDATVEETLDFLLRRDQEAQEAVNAVAKRVDELEKSTPQELDQLRERMERHVAQELTGAAAAYRPLRVVGTFALAIGLLCVTLANFV